MNICKLGMAYLAELDLSIELWCQRHSLAINVVMYPALIILVVILW